MTGKKSRNDQPSASLAPHILNDYKYGSRNEKLKVCIEAKHGIVNEFEQTNIQRTGDVLETPLIKEAGLRLGLVDVQTDIETVVPHPDLPLQCSLDGRAVADQITIKHNPDKGIYLPHATKIKIDGPGVIECKCTRDYPEDVPANWRGVLQLQTQMECADVEWGVLCVLYQSTDFRIFIYKRDPHFIDKLRPAVLDWQRRIETEEYFEMEILDQQHDGILLYPEADDETINLEDDVLYSQVQTIVLCDETIKTAQASKKAATAKLMEAMGNHKKAVCNDYVIDWGMMNYKAKPEKVVPATEAYSVRKKTLKINKLKNGA